MSSAPTGDPDSPGNAGNARTLRRWQREREARSRRELRVRAVLSVLGHGALVAFFAFAPRSSQPALQAVVKVNLVASIPSPAPAAKATAPAAQAKAKPAPPPPVAKPAPPPPPPQAKKVLPKEAPKAVPKKPKPKPRPQRQPPPKPEELDYDDALSQLRGELGETPDEPSVQELLDSARAAGPAADQATSSRGAAELSEWQQAVMRHLRKSYFAPPEFLNRGLRTELIVTLTSDGTVKFVTVARSSGDAFADENAVRALRNASPLPVPPQPGDNNFSFIPEILP